MSHIIEEDTKEKNGRVYRMIIDHSGGETTGTIYYIDEMQIKVIAKHTGKQGPTIENTLFTWRTI